MEYLPRIQYVAAQSRNSRVTVEINETPENFTGRIIFMSMFNDTSWGSKDNKIECESNAVKIVHKVNGTKLLRRRC